MHIETATIEHRGPGDVAAAFLQAATALTESVGRSLQLQDPEACAAFWACLTKGGSIELRLETTLNGHRLMLQAAPPGGDPVRVLDVPLTKPGPVSIN